MGYKSTIAAAFPCSHLKNFTFCILPNFALKHQKSAMLRISTFIISIIINISLAINLDPIPAELFHQGNHFDIAFESNSTHIKINTPYILTAINPTVTDSDISNRAWWKCVWLQYINKTTAMPIKYVNPDDIKPQAIIAIPEEEGELQLQCRLVINTGPMWRRKYITAIMSSRVRYQSNLPLFNATDQPTITPSNDRNRNSNKLC